MKGHKSIVSRLSSFIKAVAFVLKNGSDTILRDSVTTLYNKGAFRELALQELKSVTRNSGLASLIMADMNDLKKANDCFGHLEEDRLLRVSARIFLDILRESDIVGRYGGDEFIVLLPGTNLIGAEEVIKKLRAALAEKSIEWSFGVVEAVLPSKEDLMGLSRSQLHKKWEVFLEDLIAEADKLLYKDKLLSKRH